MDDTNDPGQSRNNEHSDEASDYDESEDETELFKGMLRENQNSNLYREGNSDSRVVSFKCKIRVNKTGKRKKRDKKSSVARTQRQRVEDLLFNVIVNKRLIFILMLIIPLLRVSKLVETVERKMLCLLPCTFLVKAVVYVNDLGLDPMLIPWLRLDL